jgi:hypothetical protein
MPLVNHGRRNIQLAESGETEAGDAGTRPAEGWPDAAPGRAPRRGSARPSAPRTLLRPIPPERPDALKIPGEARSWMRFFLIRGQVP